MIERRRSVAPVADSGRGPAVLRLIGAGMVPEAVSGLR
jgi:hypothetical protein